MNDKTLVKKVLKKYSSRNGYYILQKSALNIKNASKIKNKNKKSKRIYLEISDMLDKSNFDISIEELSKKVSHIKAPTLDDCQLSLFNYSLCKCIFNDLLNSKNTDIPQKHLFLLSSLESFDYDDFYNHASMVHRILLKNNPDHYRDSDKSTKQHARRYVYAYSKKHSITEFEAAKIYRGEMSKQKKLSNLYFPVIIALSALICIIIALFLSPFYSIPLFLPILEAIRIISHLILSKKCIPSKIPALEIDKIPDKGRTVAVITTLIDKNNIPKLLDKIEDYHNRTSDDNLCFGILADLPDSREYYTNSDENHIKTLLEGFNALNEKYQNKFCLFIRNRSYISTEERYSGKERKRGAVLALCGLLNRGDDQFDKIICPPAFLNGSSYLITLDSDTEIGMGDAKALISAMLHPNNQPIIENGIVTRGHALLQPKIVPSLGGSTLTPFTITMSGVGGNDGYRSVDFELYQTLFDRSTFCGKGIIHIKAFDTLFANAFPEERILSHDTIEGGYGRCGYISDVTLTDSCPKNPISYYKRYHRWLRGDIQSGFCLGKTITNLQNKKVKNPLDPLGKIMVADNILRAFLPTSVFISLVLAFFAPFYTAVIITLLAILPIILPFIISIFHSTINSPRKFYSNAIKNLWQSFCHMIFELAAIPTKFAISADAIIRATWRLAVSKKHLMQWVTAEAGERLGGKLPQYLVKFSFSTVIGVLTALFAPNSFFHFFAILWILFFLLCYAMGSEYPKERKISPQHKEQLEKYSLDCWYYFKDTVTKKTCFLPPDNYQISPVKRLAMRTSPTNIGLYLLCCGAAYKFSFIPKTELKQRLSDTVKTIESLPKYRGHLYNWYDISTLKVLGTPYVSTVDSGNFLACIISLIQILKQTDSRFFQEEISRLQKLYDNMPLGFLFNKKKGLFAIGIDTATGQMGENCYDILMSEVRTAVYIAVCRKEVDWQVYYKMGCPIISRNGHIGLASWSGTAFEYFMPALFLPIYNNSIYYESLGFALSEQIKDKEKGIWGRSESGYFAFDNNMNYQYRAFGTPELAIDPEAAKHNVIAPYASFLSLCMSYRQPCANLLKLEKTGMYGKYGFYEAIDFTQARVGKGNAVIYSWMSHHLAMSMLAACNACHNGCITQAFMSNPQMRCGDELLSRKIPVDIKLNREMQTRKEPAHYKNRYDIYQGSIGEIAIENKLPQSSSYSNSIMGFTAFSNGYLKLKYQNAAVTYPFFHNGNNLRGFNFRIEVNNKVINPLENASFSAFMTGVVYQKNMDSLSISTSVALHGELNAVCINFILQGEFDQITSLALFEPVLDSVSSFQAHPAFSGLSIDCKYDPHSGLLIYKRKKRENPHEALYMAVGIAGGADFEFMTRRDSCFHMLYNDDDVTKLIYEKFDNCDGACINPVCALKKTSSNISKNKEGNSYYSLDIIIYTANSLNEIYSAQNRLRHDKTVHISGYSKAFSKSLERIGKEQLIISGADKEVIELCSCLRADFAIIPYKNKENSPYSHTHNLYKHGISNDLPIVCLNLTANPDSHMLKAIETFSRANRYMRCLGEPFDLVVLCPVEQVGDSYFSPKTTKLKEALEKWTGVFGLNQKGGIFLIYQDCRPDELTALANLTFDISGDCIVSEIIERIKKQQPPSDMTVRRIVGANQKIIKGNFQQTGFVIDKGVSKRPWSYTYANTVFGTLLTHNSLGFSWFGNSRQNRLTPWSNDPLFDLFGEVLIMKINTNQYDLAAISSTVTFERGQAVYTGSVGGIDYRLCVGISINLPFKYITFSATNENPAKTEFSVYLKITPALGDKQGCHYKTVKTPNFTVYSNINRAQMGDISLFVTSEEKKLTLESSKGATAFFLLGAVNRNNDKVLYKILSLTDDKLFSIKAMEEYKNHFEAITSVFQVKSSCPQLDCMFNYYAPYQAYCQRILARSGFYQSGGAYGFRDQLQDALSLVYNRPEILKKQLLRCASKQFPTGDVLHWWHERSYGEFEVLGARTRCSDDYLWLPYCTARYVTITGDKDILDLPVLYVEGEELKEKEQERCMTVYKSRKKEKLYYHCIRALMLGLSRRDEKGLCLIGSCDWNDGFSNVGKEGKGTSIWLTRFLQITLKEFAQIADKDYQKHFINESNSLDLAVEEHGYNGEYYIRSFFDNGEVMGDKSCEECKIDILPQAFSAIAKGKNPRTEKAMKVGIDTLFDRENKLLKLFSPPFKNSAQSPGYVMAYVEGTRENGGQYTHGALWGALGCFHLGKHSMGYQILLGANPAYRSTHPKLNKAYGAEPYAFAGDIYTNKDHLGRGGWSHYTGAAGWFYSIVLSKLLGYEEFFGEYFTLNPCLCREFDGFELTVNKKDTIYRIHATIGDKTEYILDDKIVNNHFIFDKGEHFLKITVAKS